MWFQKIPSIPYHGWNWEVLPTPPTSPEFPFLERKKIPPHHSIISEHILYSHSPVDKIMLTRKCVNVQDTVPFSVWMTILYYRLIATHLATNRSSRRCGLALFHGLVLHNFIGLTLLHLSPLDGLVQEKLIMRL